jgi:DNA gyrase subunit A
MVVILTESGLIYRIPASSFRAQRRGGKGVKTNDDIVNSVIRTNTVDSLMIFTDKGNMYRLLVNDIPETNNTTKGVPITTLIKMQPNEKPTITYSIYRDTDAKFVLFITKNGLVKKTPLDEYTKTKKKTGISAITMREGDSLAGIGLIKDENLMLVTKNGMCIKFNSFDIAPTSRATQGVKGIDLKPEDEVVACLVVKDNTDSLGVFSTSGYGKRIAANEFVLQKRGGKGVICYKGELADAALLNNEDNILIVGLSKSICISAEDIPILGRTANGVILIKDKIQSVSKV